jgi:6-phosphogluconolactonase (cycloisomerase 2 family)
VYAFAVRSNGSLAPLPGSPFSTVSKPQALAIDSAGKYLYVSSYPASTNPATSEIDAFSISTVDGSLTPVPGAPYVEPNSNFCANGAWDIAIHPNGKFLVIPNMCQGIVVYQIERSTGTLTLVKGSPFPVPYPPSLVVQSIAMDPLGQYFWVSTQYCFSGCNQTTDTWKLDTQTGVPTYLESGPSACGLLTRSDPSGKFVYVIGDMGGNGCGDSTLTPAIWGLGVNRSNGAVKNVGGSPFTSPNSDWFLTDGLTITP